jgi:glycerol-3-phosphate cytidylyltransferase-like family protein
MSFADPNLLDAKNSAKNTDKNIPKEYFGHVMCFGTFDIFHPGHQFYLSEAAKLATCMTIVIARDHRVFSGK